MSRGRVVVVNPVHIANESSGLGVLVAQLVTLLAEFYDVSYLGLDDVTHSTNTGISADPIESFCSDITLLKTRSLRSKAARRLLNVGFLIWGTITGTPLSAYHDSPSRLRAKARASSVGASAIFVIHTFGSKCLPQRVRCPSALFVIDVQTVAQRQRVAASHGLARALAMHQAWTTRRFERRQVHRFSVVVTTQEADSARIGALGVSQDRLLPMPIATAPRPQVSHDYQTRAAVVFVGVLSHWPNADAATWLCRDIWPLIREKVQRAELLIIGPGMLPEVCLREKGVVHMGSVPDLDRAIPSRAVMVAPMRAGTGIKMKVVDAMRRGLATVATSLAVEGLPVENGRDILIADPADSFADAVSRLLLDEALYRTVAAGAGDTWERNFSPAAAREKMSTLMLTLQREYLT